MCGMICRVMEVGGGRRVFYMLCSLLEVYPTWENRFGVAGVQDFETMLVLL